MAEIMTYADDTDQIQEISQHIVISRDKSVYVPEIIRKSIVYRDHNVECLTFDCPRYWSGIDISELNIYVNYIAEGQKKKKEDPGSFLCENVVVDEDNTDIFHFDWRITNNASEFPDKLIFLVCAKSVDAEGNEDVHWNSHLCKELEVQEGLEASSAIVKRYPDVIESILSKLGKQIELRNSGTAIQYRNAGENTWVDLVQLEDIRGDAAVIIESNFKGSDTTANIIEKTGEAGDKWYSTDEGVYYMLSTSGEWINCGSGENLKKIEDEIDALKGDISQLSEENVDRGTSLWAIVKKTAFVEALTDEELTKFKTAWGIIDSEEEPDTPVEPDVPEVTLTSISATYTGGDVAVGTALTDLTGITVTAHYSDGSTANVTGYTLSGTIAEGSNTITVSYNGLTTTFTVIGVAESTEEPVVLSGYQITEFGNIYADRESYEQWKWNNGIANRFMFNTKLFPAGTYWIRSLLKNPNSLSGYAPVMYQTADADWLTTKSDTPTAITEDSFTTAVNLGDTNSQTWLGVYSDGSYALVPNNDTSGVAGYVYLKKVTVPEGYYGILSIGSGSGSNVGVYVENWITVFNEDPTDNITCTEVAE